MNIDRIEPGQDFVDAINHSVAEAGVLLDRVLHVSKQRLTVVRQLRYLPSFRLTTVTSFPLAATSSCCDESH
jgi:hypothetical protein